MNYSSPALRDPITDQREARSIVQLGAPAAPFIWGVGIECSFIPQIAVDQFKWTQHNRFWRDDLRMVREGLGATHLRYALPWYEIQPERGKFDWSMADERVDYCRELGIELMMDVMHFGTPAWLPQAVGDPRFPDALETFTVAMVERYGDVIKTWCPFNEPLIGALFSGDLGFWPPFSRKWRGYMPVLSRVVQAVNRSIGAIRSVRPDAQVLLCDAFENFQTRSPELEGEVELRNLRRFVVLDLLAGRVDHHHPLYGWLTSFGFSEIDLDYLHTNPRMPDVIGLDYYPHSDWQIEMNNGAIRQRRSDVPLGIRSLATDVYNRYGLPMMVTETSIDGPPVAREIWLESLTEDLRRLRGEGVPMMGLIWWPLFDQVDWDGALRHRVGKIHRVGLYTLNRQSDGTLKRSRTPLADVYSKLAARGDEPVGELDMLAASTGPSELQHAALLTEASEWSAGIEGPQSKGRDWAGGLNGKARTAAGTNGTAASSAGSPQTRNERLGTKRATSVVDPAATGRYGIVVFSHLRWGFVWQRPQQYLSRFAKLHPVLFVEEPVFDLSPGAAPRLELHRVLPTLTVACPHCPPETATDPNLADMLRAWVNEALETLNIGGEFERPLLWYYSPMDAAWSLGHFENRGVVYDCMDELSQFTGAPKRLVDNERRLIEHADVVFTGGYELWMKKRELHPNVHFYGCGVEVEHFRQALDPDTTIPPDIDFMPRPIVGWFGVVDERVDYHLLAEVARLRPDWSIAVVGPVVKVDPNLLPHAPNLHWMGGRDYQVLPNYCKAFDVCMMAFAINRSTEFINPTKALEYFATGRPVVSTPVRDVLRQYSELVEIAATPREFVDKVEMLLRDANPQRIEAAMALAAKSSWEANVTEMRAHIGRAIGLPDRRSLGVRPHNGGKAEGAFAGTQGS